MLLLRRSSKSSTFSDFPSKVGSDAVKAFLFQILEASTFPSWTPEEDF